MKLLCPNCGSEIPFKDVGIADGLALCGHCRDYFDCKDWLEAELQSPERLQHPPAGAAYRQLPDGFEVGVSTRSYQWFLLPFACLWVVMLLPFTWVLLVRRPVPGVEFESLVIIFLIPFYLGALFLWWHALMPFFGKVVVRVQGNAGTVFQGVGRVGWKRRFDWGSVRKVWYDRTLGGRHELITLESDRAIHFARGVKHERLVFLLTALRVNHHRRREQNSRPAN